MKQPKPCPVCKSDDVERSKILKGFKCNSCKAEMITWYWNRIKVQQLTVDLNTKRAVFEDI